MAPLIIVETHDARGTRRERVRIASFPATIGRAYDSDVVLDDPYVDARHLVLRLDESGAVVVEDAGSANGSWMRSGRELARVTSVPLRGVAELRLGHTVVRLIDATHPVGAALPDLAPASGLLERLANRRVRLTVVLAALGALVAAAYAGTYEKVSASDVAGIVVAWVGFLAAWAGVWALVTRMTRHRFDFQLHFAIAVLASFAGWILGVLSEWGSFLAPGALPIDVVSSAAFLALVVTALFGHLTVTTLMPPAQRWKWAAVPPVAGFVLFGALALADGDESVTRLEAPGVLKPAFARLAAVESVQSFVAAAAELRKDVDEAAAEKK